VREESFPIVYQWMKPIGKKEIREESRVARRHVVRPVDGGPHAKIIQHRSIKPHPRMRDSEVVRDGATGYIHSFFKKKDLNHFSLF
jgi:hypothetical protein